MMSPEKILDRMFAEDHFSQWLGITPIDIQYGTCTLRMKVRRDMLNGFGVAHGGITFSLADSAFAFACNSHGRHTVSIHCTVEHVVAVFEGDELTAIAREEHSGNSVSNYAISITRQDGKAVAFFRGVAYHKKKDWTE